MDKAALQRYTTLLYNGAILETTLQRDDVTVRAMYRMLWQSPRGEPHAEDLPKVEARFLIQILNLKRVEKSSTITWFTMG